MADYLTPQKDTGVASESKNQRDLLEAIITEQREMMRAMRASEGRFRIALDSAPIAVFNMDRDLRYTWLYKGRYGFTVEQMLGKRDDELNPEFDLSDVIALKQSVIETGQGVRKEVKVRINGEWIYFYDNLEPITNEAGEVTGLTGAALDITEQHHLEVQHQEAVTQMEVQRRLLEHRERERQDIARDVHDGPIQSLVSVLFNLQAAKETIHDGEATAILDEVAAGLKRAVQELRAVVNELRPPEILRFGLSRAIQIHSEDFRVSYPHIKLDLDLVEDANLLPEETCLALYRIYQEAISNVVRHSDASQVWIRYYPSGQNMALEIKDNGKGFEIPSDWVSLTRRDHFGMAGMKERVDAVGGKIQIASKPGRGTTVKVKVPMGACAAKI